MTKPIKYDYFSPEIHPECRFITVLLEQVVIETAEPDLDKLYERGIYSFPQRKQRDAFTKLCNFDKIDTVAFEFNRQPLKRETTK